MLEFKTNFFVDTGFGLQVIITHQIAPDVSRTGVTTLALAIEDVIGVSLVETRCLIGACNPHFQREIVA